MIAAVYEALGGWFWMLLGLLLLILEIFAPGVLFLWLGIAALLVGLLDFAFHISWQSEMLAFGFLALLSVFVGRFLLNRFRTLETDKPMLNERSKALIGREFSLAEPIVDGQGRVKVLDSYWRVNGPDCEVGGKVRVVEADGAVLTVELIK
ncbi:MAG: NfeD family protein [Cohaesibacter sp.]|nr:NfeD family protein [Cohaesibacter sp.]